MDFVNRLAGEFKLRPQQVQAAVELLDAGNTIPFIARYRKEATGSLDDQVLREMAERLEYLRNLEKRGTWKSAGRRLPLPWKSRA